MKKILPVTILLAASYSAVNAQEPADALRLSWNNMNGTARSQAIGGALTSLGGDPTSLYTNPAGLAFYKTGDFVFTPSYRRLNNKSNYIGREEKDSEGKFTLGTTGFVFGTGTRKNGKVNDAFSVGFNTTADFRSNILYRGMNYQSSYSQKFLEEIQNQNIKDANVVANDFPHGSTLAFNTYWIDTVGGGTPGTHQFQSRAANILATGLIQEQKVQTRGGIYELAVGGASSIKDKLFVGGTIGVPIVYYNKSSTFTEADATADPNNRFDFATFTEDITTQGVGLNMKVGLIYKPQEFWRLGLSFHTPTVYNLTDTYGYIAAANTENGQGTLEQNSADFNGGAMDEFSYYLISPYKVAGSVSFVIREIQDVRKQRGFITADVEYVNHMASSYSADNEENTSITAKPYLKSLNNAIDKAYKGTFNFRAGAELKFTTIMFRAGASYFGNPYRDIKGEKGEKLNLSGGLGYRNKGRFIDVTYVHSMNKDVHVPYRLQHSPYDVASIRSSGGNLVITAGVKF